MFDMHCEILVLLLDELPVALAQLQHNIGPVMQATGTVNPSPAVLDDPVNNRLASHSACCRAPAWLCYLDIAPQSSESVHV